MSIVITPQQIVETAREWIGTPYHHQASLKGVGCDCIGLVRGVFYDLTGLRPDYIPPYTPDWGEYHDRETLYEGLKPFLTELSLDHPIKAERVTITQPGDVVLFRMRETSIAKHCGFVAFKDGQRTLIHAATTYPVSEVPFDHGWRLRLAYAFRFPGVEPVDTLVEN